ncbi:hypothetical protein [Ferroglobus sp.]|uniref:hypothetical protein n=1 Tax=Ferroglobus sp. TaxID=2614230 RepID=UPI0025BCEEAB|nr:hypothetical protein [Ferroglobus sp.]
MESVNRAQILILFALVVSGIIVGLSVVYTQNLLAGMETSRTLLVFPKEEIRNLREIVERDYLSVAALIGNDPSAMSNFANNVSDQIRMLYAQKGCYADVTAFKIEIGKVGLAFNAKIVYVGGGLEYNDTLYCEVGGGCT